MNKIFNYFGLYTEDQVNHVIEQSLSVYEQALEQQQNNNAFIMKEFIGFNELKKQRDELQ